MSSDTDILVVEDEPADANLIREMLTEDHETTVVDTVEAAVSTLDSLRDAGQLPELVLLDLRLPDGSGFDVLKALSERPDTEDLAVILLTSSEAKSDRERALELGADGFETKPMDIDEFASTIADIEQTYMPAQT
jgi:CheY-like chemotaxis protein